MSTFIKVKIFLVWNFVIIPCKMGKYTRKTDRKLIFTKENLRIALQRIANGESKRRVAESMGTKESTLRKRLKAVSTQIQVWF